MLPEDKGELCLLRLTGIVSKHHQSSAPLSSGKLLGLIRGLKTLPDYSRVGFDNDQKPRITSIEEWCDASVDLGWALRDIRCLEDYENHRPVAIDLHKVSYLLRFIDAIHQHRCRAGSRTKIETRLDFYIRRSCFITKECDRLIRILQDSPQGSKAYQAAFEEYVTLRTYREQLLENQEPHLWRQEIVEKREILSMNDEVSIVYFIRKATLSKQFMCDLESKQAWDTYLNEFINKIEDKNQRLTIFLNKLIKKDEDVEYAYWIANFLDDVIGSEIKGQERPAGKLPLLLEGILEHPKLFFIIRLPDGGEFKLSIKEIYEL
jgi:hypothetical protein